MNGMYVKLQNDICVMKYECFYLQMKIFIYSMCMFIFAFSNYALHFANNCWYMRYFWGVFACFLGFFGSFQAFFNYFRQNTAKYSYFWLFHVIFRRNLANYHKKRDDFPKTVVFCRFQGKWIFFVIKRHLSP